MYVTPQMLQDVYARYGAPVRQSFSFPVDREEYHRIKSSQKDGRKHDVTFYIIKDHKVVVIAKHFYQPGMYRAPSGGLRPGESFESGIKREAWEETGCHIRIVKFLLETEVTFVWTNGDRRRQIEWTSYVFQADYEGGDFLFTDKREIREVRLAGLDEFEQFSRIMRQTNIGGLHYRASLHDAVKKLLRF
jgi:8-oxo-dGTP pyrophosphatase MutT (NUDIX family)